MLKNTKQLLQVACVSLSAALLALSGCAKHGTATTQSAALPAATTQPLLANTPAAQPGALPRDTNNVYGHFDNGVAYIVRKTINPPGKLSIDLHVRTGAINENDDQKGLAHFLEHMAFKGSTHYPPGELIKYLSSLGLTFGADTNAHTNFNETVFKLSMPDNKPETITAALTVMSDYASGLLLDAQQIDGERGVILEEARTRKGAGERIGKLIRKQLFAGTRIESHDVIGEEDQIKSFPRSTFLDYWNTWYRPENMTLIVAGDIDPATVIGQAKEKLGSFTARAAARPAQLAGLKPFTAPRGIIVTDPEQVAADVSIIGMKPSPGKIETVSQHRREVVAGLGEWIVNRRFHDRITRGGAPFREASVDTSDFLLEAMEISASAEGQPQDWNRILDATIEEISRAMDYGFSAQEIDLAKRNLLSQSEWAVKTEASTEAKDWVARLASDVGRSRPIMSAQQRLDLNKEIASTLTSDEINAVFKENFTTKNFAYVLVLPAKEGVAVPTESDILAAATAAWSKKTVAPTENAAIASILAAQPAAGKATSTQVDEKLGVSTYVFDNGVVFHHKFMDSMKNQVAVRLVLPGGPIEETEKTKGLSVLAGQIIDQPATHRLTSPQVRDLMTGKNVSVDGGFSIDALSITVKGSPSDLPAGLELVHALLTDATLEQSAVDQWKKAQLDELKQKSTSAKAQIGDAVAQTLGANDIRLAPLTEADVKRLNREEAEQWFNRVAKNAAIEITVVGDLPKDQAMELVAKYVGSLPKRSGTFTDLDNLRKLNRPAGPFVKTIQFEGITPTAIVMAGYVGCEETSLDRRPLSMASMILSDRMVERIRVKDNLVYSIGCMNRPASGMPGLGQFFAAAPTDPKNAERLSATVIELIQAMAQDGPTDQEMNTARKQIINTLTTQMKEPDFWITQLGTTVYHHRDLNDLHSVPDVYNTYTAELVRDTLRKYATPAGEFRLASVPKTQAATKPAAQPSSTSQPAPAAVR